METKTYIDQITKWYMTKIFLAALPPTKAPEVRVMTSQKYIRVPFLGTTWNLVQTKAYIALFTKWYATNFFGRFTPGKSPQSLNYDVILTVTS